jgi:hypothetical protein
MLCVSKRMVRTAGFEPARVAPAVFKTAASAFSPRPRKSRGAQSYSGKHETGPVARVIVVLCWSGRRDSNPRPSPWQGDALPTEPLPQDKNVLAAVSNCSECRVSLSTRFDLHSPHRIPVRKTGLRPLFRASECKLRTPKHPTYSASSELVNQMTILLGTGVWAGSHRHPAEHASRPPSGDDSGRLVRHVPCKFPGDQRCE